MKLPTTLLLSIALMTGSHAATIFLTNNSAKTLASNEGDAVALLGAGAGATRTLTLSADDGGATIDMNFIRVQSDIAGNSGNQTIGMDADSMGIGNDKWGDKEWNSPLTRISIFSVWSSSAAAQRSP